ncbi:DUF924 family protein [Moritella yayanosii]|uniref:DUF924 domain-containing protein n=1 Tax=Moritella yayanosii TaxID=69539 RepID=A0A330LW00_9GAMM|nr:DUF924 family protein [Moritella yayanosii]SQD79978.1 conserved protein of unknown function [Moritella yayanosii]
MYKDVIKFWFEDINPAKWWIKDSEFDQTILTRFSELHQRAVAGELFHWRRSAEGRLAEIIILDQFSRNMFRDTPRAFVYDSMALVLAQEAIAFGADKELSQLQCSFLYLPFMHSESAIIHQQAVFLYQGNDIQTNLDFELQHQAIIEQFGRYPHRNTILGRKSTVEERAFLDTPGSSF